MNTTLPLLAGLCVAAAPLHAAAYRLVDLGTIHGESHAFTISGIRGGPRLIAGSSTGIGAHFSAYRFAPDTIVLAPLAPDREAALLDLASDGTAVGVSYSLGGMTWTSFISSPGGISTSGPFAARAINANAEIAGTTTVISSNFGGLTLPRACRVTSGNVQALPTLGGSTSLGLAIDDAGRVAGSSMNANNAASRPCLWIGLTATDLGTLGGLSGQVYALRSDAAVGASQLASGVWHATKWNLSAGGAVTSRIDLGALGPSEASTAHAINAAGDVVGTSNFRAFLWHTGVMTDLNTLASAPGWVLETAWDIDDLGRIVGTGSLWGIPRAFLLTLPCPADLNADDFVDDGDFQSFAAAYDILLCSDPSMPAGCPADLNADSNVDDADFSQFAAAYNELYCP